MHPHVLFPHVLHSLAQSAEANVLALKTRGLPASQSCRALLRSIAGNPPAKLSHADAGAAAALVALLPVAPADAAGALASLCYGCERAAQRAADADAAARLVAQLFHPDPRAHAAAARALDVLLDAAASAAPVRERLLCGMPLCEQPRRVAPLGGGGGDAVRAPGDEAPAVARLVALLREGPRMVSATCAAVLGKLAGREQVVRVMAKAGAVQALIGVFEEDVLVAEELAVPVLDALVVLAMAHAELARCVVAEGEFVDLLMTALLERRGQGVRLSAARLLVALHCQGRAAAAVVCSFERDKCYCFKQKLTRWSSSVADELRIRNGCLSAEQRPSCCISANSHFMNYCANVDLAILRREDRSDSQSCLSLVAPSLSFYLNRSALVNALSELTLYVRPTFPIGARVQAFRTIACLVAPSAILQGLCCKLEVVEQLAEALKCQENPSYVAARPVPSGTAQACAPHAEKQTQKHQQQACGAQSTPQLCASSGSECELVISALECCAAITADNHTAREMCVRARVLPAVVLGLDHPNLDIVQAAVKCVQSFSRSVKIVRRELVFVNVAVPLLRLLGSNTESELCMLATSCICNISMEFSPLQQTILTDTNLPLLVNLLEAQSTKLRFNVLCALQNMMFRADTQTRALIMRHLGYPRLADLCMDGEAHVRERALALLKNITHGIAGLPQDLTQNALDDVMTKMEGRFFSILEAALRPESDPALSLQALYVLSNVTVTSEQAKVSILQSSLPPLILVCMKRRDAKLRVATLWCTIHLAWRGADDRRPSPAPSPIDAIRGDKDAAHTVTPSSGSALWSPRRPLPASLRQQHGVRFPPPYLAAPAGGYDEESDAEGRAQDEEAHGASEVEDGNGQEEAVRDASDSSDGSGESESDEGDDRSEGEREEEHEDEHEDEHEEEHEELEEGQGEGSRSHGTDVVNDGDVAMVERSLSPSTLLETRLNRLRSARRYAVLPPLPDPTAVGSTPSGDTAGPAARASNGIDHTDVEIQRRRVRARSRARADDEHTVHVGDAARRPRGRDGDTQMLDGRIESGGTGDVVDVRGDTSTVEGAMAEGGSPDVGPDTSAARTRGHTRRSPRAPGEEPISVGNAEGINRSASDGDVQMSVGATNADVAASSDDAEPGPPSPSAGLKWRIWRLRALGFEKGVADLCKNDDNVDVVGRAKEALELFGPAERVRQAPPVSLAPRMGTSNAGSGVTTPSPS